MVHKSSSCHRHNTAVPMLLQLGKILLLLSLVAASPASLPAAQSSTKTDAADTTSTAATVTVETALRGSKIITKPIFASSTTTTTTATAVLLPAAVRRLQETVKGKDDKTKEVKAESKNPTKPPAQEADVAKDKKVPPIVLDANTKTPAKGESTSGSTNTTPEEQTKLEKDPQKESCESATSCASCEKISTTVKTTGNAYCLWNSTFCGTIPLHGEKDKLFVNSCPKSSSSSSSLSGGGDNEDSSFSGRLQGFALLLAIFGVLLIVRQRIVHGRSGFHSSLDRAIDQVASSVASSTGGNSRGSRGSRYHEVPVDDDDEWGWEDSKPRASDVELSSWRTSSGGATAADDGMNNNASLADSNVSASSMKNKLSPQPIKKRMSSGDQGLLPTTSPSLSSSSGAAGGLPPMTISSLGKPISALSKKTDLPSQQQAPKKEEDIFASMGLAARPTFTAPSTSVTSPSMEFRRRASPPLVVANANTNSNSGWGARNTTSTTTADPQQQQQQQGGGGDEAWDDDADLDDLLND